MPVKKKDLWCWGILAVVAVPILISLLSRATAWNDSDYFQSLCGFAVPQNDAEREATRPQMELCVAVTQTELNIWVDLETALRERPVDQFKADRIHEIRVAEERNLDRIRNIQKKFFPPPPAGPLAEK